MQKVNYLPTKIAGYVGFFVQAIVNNFLPILFIALQDVYDLNYARLAFLIIFNFGNYREKGEKVKLNTEGFNLIQEIDSLTKMKNKKNLSIIINSFPQGNVP